MSKLDAVLPRSAVHLRPVLTRWNWGPDTDRRRVIAVTVVEREDGLVAQVVGAEGRELVLLDEKAALTAAPNLITLVDGTEWRPSYGGCGCGTPLKSFDPRTSKLRDARPT